MLFYKKKRNDKGNRTTFKPGKKGQGTQHGKPIDLTFYVCSHRQYEEKHKKTRLHAKAKVEKGIGSDENASERDHLFSKESSPKKKASAQDGLRQENIAV